MLVVPSSAQLQRGDLLLKHFQVLSPSNLTIIVPGSGLQANNKGGTASLTHAAIYVGTDAAGAVRIAEATGKGLAISNVRQMSHRYIVYRFSANLVANNAADLAEEMVGRADGVFGRYAVGNALKGMLFHSADLGKKGDKVLVKEYRAYANGQLAPNLKFYCSNFAVMMYNFASEKAGLPPAIKADYRHVTPNAINAILLRDSRWQRTKGFTCFKNN